MFELISFSIGKIIKISILLFIWSGLVDCVSVFNVMFVVYASKLPAMMIMIALWACWFLAQIALHSIMIIYSVQRWLPIWICTLIGSKSQCDGDTGSLVHTATTRFQKHRTRIPNMHITWTEKSHKLHTKITQNSHKVHVLCSPHSIDSESETRTAQYTKNCGKTLHFDVIPHRVRWSIIIFQSTAELFYINPFSDEWKIVHFHTTQCLIDLFLFFILFDYSLRPERFSHKVTVTYNTLADSKHTQLLRS